MKPLLSVLLLSWISVSWALVPLDSIILGNNSENYDASKVDPLNFVFKSAKSKDNTPQEITSKRHLREYLGIYQEGQNLTQFCEKNIPIEYSSFDQKEHVKLSMVATLQYLGLDLTSRAIGAYARYFEFEKEEYQNLIRRIVGNYCSENLTIISLKQLTKNLLNNFTTDPDLTLPGTANNLHFSPDLEKMVDQRRAKEAEFLYTIKLFRAFCSWGGNIEDLRLLTPLASNPFIMGLVTRQMTNRKIVWNPASDKLSLEKDENTIQVYCENLICRKTGRREFLKKIPMSLGKISLQNDLHRLYCNEFQKIQYKVTGQEKRIKKWILHQSLQEDNFLVSQFIALITGIPDFMIRVGSFHELQPILKSPLEWEWGKWAKVASSQFSREILYEESVTVEKVPRKFYFDPTAGNFQVVFDINLGELDKGHVMESKLGVRFNLEISLKFLKWIRNEWVYRDPKKVKKNERLVEIFKFHILNQVEKAKSHFVVAPWKEDLESLIVYELLDQLEIYSGKKFDSLSEGTLKIPIKLRYGLFALKYFHYRFRLAHGIHEIDL